MALTIRQGPYGEKSFAKSAAPYSLSFLASETVTAMTYQDESANGSSGVGLFTVARGSDGVYTLTCRSRYYKIIPMGAPSAEESGDTVCNIAAIVDGVAAANTVDVHVRIAGTLDDPECDVHVSLRLVSSPGVR